MLSGALVTCAALLKSALPDELDAQLKTIAEAKGRTPDAERLQDLFKVEWAYTFSAAPEFATYVGSPGYDTKWTVLSAAAVAERKRSTGRPLGRLATIDRATLSATDPVSYDLFKRQLEEAIESARFPTELAQTT
ncbi:MAG: DUF885 family protein [Undibacterium sp.]|nr:DUF885 family protein [Opitutaceae bacterium]